MHAVTLETSENFLRHELSTRRLEVYLRRAKPFLLE